jgi:ABC-2 type transport system permease protein
MTAAFAVAAKDGREMLRAGWLWWAALAIIVLAAASALSAAVTRADVARTLAAAQAQEAQTWLDQGERNPHAAAHFSRFAVRPPSALEDVDPGLRAFVGGHVWMEAHLQRPAEARPAEDRADASPLGPLTPSWIVQNLLALLGLMIGAVSVAREREEGRLALLQAHGASTWAIALGKVIGVAGLTLALSAVLLLAATAGAWAQIFAGAGLYPDAAWRLALWCGAALGYGVIFAIFGVALSAWFATTRASLLSALALWAIMVAVAPRVAMAVAEATAPAPAPATFVAALRSETRAAVVADSDGHNTPASATVVDDQGRVLSVRGLRLQRGEEIGDAIHDRRYGELRVAFGRQADVFFAFASLSPTIAFSSLSAGLTGSDLAHQIDFLAQAEAQRRVIIRQLNEDDIFNAGDRGGAYLADRALWEKIPHFHYTAPAVTAVAANYGRDGLALLGWLFCGLAFALSSTLFALRRR